MPDWPNDTPTQLALVTEELGQVLNENEILQESMADVLLANEDRGWQRLGGEVEKALTRQGLGIIATNCRVMAIASPLVKRGLQLRIAYVWGQGVEITARDEDVNEFIQTVLDDPSNVASLFGTQAREELERALGTDGQVFIAAFTSPLTGKVQFRSTPFEEVTDVINNPEDRDEPWFYLRQYDATVVRPFVSSTGVRSTRTRTATVKVLHPALGYWPLNRPKEIDGIPVRWDAPILHVSVNRLDGTTWGVPDVFAGIAWARAYESFLSDWARLMKALSKFAWRLSGDKSSKAQAAARKIQSAVQQHGGQPVGAAPATGPVGGVAASGPGVTLEAIPKSGATIDADSGRPLAAMVAASLGLPVTMLLADPGVTGARATAETLDKPTVLEQGMRRELWTSVTRRLLDYAVAQSIKAPAGPLKGTVGPRDELGREQVRLPEGVDPTIEIDWPKLDDLDPKTLVEAIAKADETGKMPPVTTMKLLLRAFGVKDIDELVEDFTDEDGNWVDPDLTAAQAAVDRHRAGGDPADLVR